MFSSFPFFFGFGVNCYVCSYYEGGQYGAFGAVTLEKSKLDMTKPQTKSLALRKLKTAIGEWGRHWGRKLILVVVMVVMMVVMAITTLVILMTLMKEMRVDCLEGACSSRAFDRKFVDAVLNEWHKTMMDLPSGPKLMRWPTTARFIFELFLKECLGLSLEGGRVVYGWSDAGAAQGALSKFLASKKGDRVSVTMLTVSSNAFGYGAFLGLYANLRYQLLCGIDKSMMNYFDVIGVELFFSTALRVLNTQVGETSRLAWLGVEADPLVQSENLLKAYNRSSEEVASPSSKWFISKNAVVSGLGLLGIKQGNNDHEAAPPKTRRKRIVRKKVTTTSA
ncbi:hypothetical protein IFM89_006991 [Coptis chinensis]|uniref:Uncharacterized protein n=1 Tax=Coptis chinensis TaxID=261450 RepID=A0A835IKF2_9MAGN|nr:hypothetical protein IFM89_006991 [Coptis chinensis]